MPMLKIACTGEKATNFGTLVVSIGDTLKTSKGDQFRLNCK